MNKDITIKHSKGDVNFSHDNDLSNDRNYIFVNVYGARGGNIVDFSISLSSIKRLRDWIDKVLMDKILGDRILPVKKPWQKKVGQLEERDQLLLAYQQDRESKDNELSEARQKIEGLEKKLLDMKNKSWLRRLFKK